MKRTKRGFTLAEILTVVAVLAVLLGVGVPSVISLKHNSEMTKLDDTAREIFLTTQNQLTARRASGMLISSKDKDIKWMNDSPSDMSGVVPPGVGEGYRYAVKYDAATGTVLEAYYTENSAVSLPADEIVSNTYGSACADKREDDMVGFYDGSNGGAPDPGEKGEIIEVNDPLVDIINEDKLYVTITMKDYQDLVGSKDPKNRVVLDAKMYELDENGKLKNPDHPVDLSFDLSKGTPNGKSLMVSKDLDQDLGDVSSRFHDLPGNTITPGANIRIVATVTVIPAAGSHNSYIAASGYDQDNSLFASREFVTDETDPTKVLEDKVGVSNRRQLQNLEGTFSGFAPNKNPGVVVNQTKDIEMVHLDVAGEKAAGWCKSVTVDGWMKEYKGNNLEIKYWDSHDGGLFKLVQTAENQDTVLSDIRMSNSYFVGAGATKGCFADQLIGQGTGRVKVNNCRIYRDVRQNTGHDAPGFEVTGDYTMAGGLVGKAVNTDFYACVASMRHISFPGHADYIGNRTCVGGFAGRLVNCRVEDSYATVMADFSSPNATGFAGYIDGSTRITNCFAASKMKAGAGECNGFYSGSGTVTNSYALVRYESGAPTFGFGPGADTGCVYWEQTPPTGKATPDGTGKITDKATAMDYTMMMDPGVKAGDWGHVTSAQTIPSNGKAYPFQMVDAGGDIGLLPYYGTWPEGDVNKLEVFEKKTAANGEKALQYVLIPKGGTATVYAQMTQGKTALDKNINVIAHGNENIVSAVAGEKKKEEKRTPIVLTAPETGVTGLSYVTLEVAPDPALKGKDTKNLKQLNVVVVVYDLEKISMELSTTTLGKTQMAVVNNPAADTDSAKLYLAEKSGPVMAQVKATPAPMWDEMEAAYKEITKLKAPDTIDAKTLKGILSKETWEKAIVTKTDAKGVLQDETKEAPLQWIPSKKAGTATIEAFWKIDQQMKKPAEAMKKVHVDVIRMANDLQIISAKPLEGEADKIIAQSAEKANPDFVSAVVKDLNKPDSTGVKYKLNSDLCPKLKEMIKTYGGKYTWACKNENDIIEKITPDTNGDDAQVILKGAGIHEFAISYETPAVPNVIFTDSVVIQLDDAENVVLLFATGGRDGLTNDLIAEGSTVHLNANGKGHDLTVKTKSVKGKWYMDTPKGYVEVPANVTYIYKTADGCTFDVAAGGTQSAAISFFQDKLNISGQNVSGVDVKLCFVKDGDAMENGKIVNVSIG